MAAILHENNTITGKKITSTLALVNTLYPSISPLLFSFYIHSVTNNEEPQQFHVIQQQGIKVKDA